MKIMFAASFEQFFLHSKPSFLSIIGVVIILASAMYVVICTDFTFLVGVDGNLR